MRAQLRRLVPWLLAASLLALLSGGCASLLGADFDRGPAGTGTDGTDGGGGDGQVAVGADGAPVTTADGAVGPCVRDDAADCVGRCGELKGRCGQVLSCGGCPSGQSCGGGGANACGTSTCTPSCTGKACGDNDGCSSVCTTGACGTGQRCVAGACGCDTTSCSGCCDGKICQTGSQDNACGKGGTACTVCKAGTACGTGDCGTCGGSGQACCAGNQCGAPGTCGGGGTVGVCGCTPNCAGKACGAGDGCNGVCNAGSCAFGLHCSSGTCACDGTSCSGCCQTGQCVGGTQTSGCGKGGVGCAVCQPPTGNGNATCDGTSCGITCNVGYTLCGTQCCQNKTVFLASGSFTGNLGGLSGADATCQSQGAGLGAGFTFKAWLSDSTTTAAARLTHSLGPYLLVNGTPVANNWNGLVSGALLHEIDMYASGATAPQTTVRTGTTTAGAYSGMSCLDWRSSANANGCGYGLTNYKDGRWTEFSGLNVACDFSPTSIYCIQQ